MKRLFYQSLVLLVFSCFISSCNEKEEPMNTGSFSQEYVVVTQHGIKNDGSEIGKEQMSTWFLTTTLKSQVSSILKPC